MIEGVEQDRSGLRVDGGEVGRCHAGELRRDLLDGRAGHPEQLELPHSAPLAELRDAVLSAGRLTVCTQCAARREIDPDHPIAEISLARAMELCPPIRPGVFRRARQFILETRV